MEKFAALEAVLKDEHRSQRDKDIARTALEKARAIDAGTTELTKTTTAYQELSDGSRAMLLALGKKHLREISGADFERYAQHFGAAQKQELCKQWREWVCPDDDFLSLIGLSRTTYWQTIRDHAKSNDVRTNAVAEMRKLNTGAAV